MVSIRLSLILVAGLVALSSAAPTETETASPEAASSTPVPETSSPSAEAGSSTTTPVPSPAPTTTEPSMAVASAQEHHSKLGNTSFTCYGRSVGYYADLDLGCKVYHFCLPGDYNGEAVFQRISYLCLTETVFDQQALDCVKADKMMAPCAESEKHYESSNAVLRQALIDQKTSPRNQNTTSAIPTPGHEASSTTTTVSDSSTTTTPAPTSSS